MIARLKEDMLELANFGKEQSGGITRPSFSDADIGARKYILSKLREAQLKIHVDAAGNIIGIRQGDLKSPFVTTGSHIDSVINGGMFDGVLGVVGGLEAIRILNEEGIKTKLPIALIVFTDEESAFSSMTGSSYFVGNISKEEMYELVNKHTGEKFSKKFDQVPKEGYIDRFDQEIRAHIELHIEQGPVLESNKKDIGVVTGIAGVKWLSITFKGKQAHAGATPMDLRRDPMVPLAKTILRVREIGLSFWGSTATCGHVEVFPNVTNVIPRDATASVDIRSIERGVLQRFESELLSSARKYAEQEKVEIVSRALFHKDPLIFPNETVNYIEQITQEFGYPYMRITSMAFHDTLNVAKITPNVGMIFVPSKNGISHSPEEWTDWEQAHKGVEVLSSVLARMAQA